MVDDDEQIVGGIINRGCLPSLISDIQNMQGVPLSDILLQLVLAKELSYYKYIYSDLPNFRAAYVPFLFLFEDWRLGKDELLEGLYGFKETLTGQDSSSSGNSSPLDIFKYYMLSAILCTNEARKKSVDLDTITLFFNEVTNSILNVENSVFFRYYRSLFGKYRDALIILFPEIYQLCKEKLESDNCLVSDLLEVITVKLKAYTDPDSIEGQPAPLFV